MARNAFRVTNQPKPIVICAEEHFVNRVRDGERDVRIVTDSCVSSVASRMNGDFVEIVNYVK